VSSAVLEKETAAQRSQPQAPPPDLCRVLHVVLSLRAGGTERLVVALVERLGPSFPVAICCLEEAGPWGEELRRAGVPVSELHRADGFRPALGYHIAAAARTHRADVIHCHHYSPFVYGAISRLFYHRARLIFTEHGRLTDDPPSSKRRWANAVLAHAADAVFAVSEDLQRHLAREGFSSRAVRVLHNGIEPGPRPDAHARLTARRRLAVAEDRCVIMSVARVDPVKDLTTLIRAFARVHTARPHVSLVIVGEGPERAALEHAIAEEGVSGAVTLTGHRSDVRELRAAADIFEGVSLTVLEAMAAGLPVVATGVGATPEVVSAETGVLVAPRDPERLAGALIALVDAPDRRKKLGANGRARLEQDFSIERIVQEYASAYRGR
jgi:glycosyltransferase involved in cell wall biosynthesis